MTRRLKEIPLPKVSRFRRVYLDSDHTGDPGVFAEFTVSPKLGADRATVNAVGEIRHKAKDLLDELEPERIPYVRFLGA